MSHDWGADVDLTNCDREPIHLLGAIQPIGFLVALSTDWTISRVSANILHFVGKAPDELIGTHVNNLFCPDAVHSLRNRLALLRGPEAQERMFRCALLGNDVMFDLAVHMSDGEVIVEAEPSTEHYTGDPTGTVRAMLARLDQAADLGGLFDEGARQVRGLTGFDRVMVYRFVPDGSGEVVAESVRSGIGSFLGLHYPPTDIPQQARELYKRNLLRVITDIDSEPVPIVPSLDEAGRPLDLSLSVLRSVSPIHIEYLRNMGVRASMSISIVIEGELWGLIACHHYGPRCPSFERRSVAELFAQMFAMRIDGRERRETVASERSARAVLDRFLGAVAADKLLLNNADWLLGALSAAIPANGVGVSINGNHALSGHTPDGDGFDRILLALRESAAEGISATDRIARLVPQAVTHADVAAGMLAIPISRDGRDYIILFRSEMIHQVRWGGDPHKPVEHGPNGPRLTPRESFAEWKQLVEGQSAPFTPSEIGVAETLRATLVEVVLHLSDEASEERRLASERQELLIAELNHRVRNILSLIRGVFRQTKPPEGTSVEEFVAMMDGRIQALARAHNQITDELWGPTPLHTLIEAEAAIFLAGKRRQVEADGEPVLLNPQAYASIALVMHELVTNSAKYGSLSAGGLVRIGWRRNVDRDLELDWIESGGPPVELPTRKGFGTTIIEQSVPYDLGGTARLEFDPAGIRARFTIPERHLAHAPKVAAKAVLVTIGDTPTLPARSDLLAGRRVLLVEDNLIIALDAEDILKRLGAREVITQGNVQDSLRAIEQQPPDIAVLDINLGDCNSFAIADALNAAGVPFLFATGYGAQYHLPPAHGARMVLQKPYTLEALARLLPELLASA